MTKNEWKAAVMYEAQHLGHADAHEDVGTFVILCEDDQKAACLYPFGLAGGAVACECGRPGCPDKE